MNSTEFQKEVRLKYFGHLAEDHGKMCIHVSTEVFDSMSTPKVIEIDGVDTLCVAYPSTDNRGLVCYINDGDANSIAKHKLLKRQAV